MWPSPIHYYICGLLSVDATPGIKPLCLESLSLCVCVCGAHFRKELTDVTGACIHALHRSGLENLLQTHLRLEVRLTDRAFD